MRRIIPVMAALGGLLCAAGAPPPGWTTPVIAGYGAIHVWPQATDRPDPARTYKALFVVDGNDTARGGVNAGLVEVARAVNEFAHAHRQFRVVVKGEATPIVFDAAAFEAKYHRPNPNLDLLGKLHQAGVTLMVCGNALFGFGGTPADVSPDVTVALSALSTEIIAQNQGYAIIQ